MYRGNYGLYGAQLSMFSRKLEAQLRFQTIPWHWYFKTPEHTKEIETRTGTHFIPALITPDNWVIHDTIALGPMLDMRFSMAPVIPTSPVQRACCFILEDFFNHWLGRMCIHTRWCYPENVAWLGPRFAANSVLNRSIDEPFTAEEIGKFTPIGEQMNQSFGTPVCLNTGVGPDQEKTVRADFEKLLTVLDEHFSQHDFLLGSRPCLADFALAGASKAHFIADPTPLSWLGQHQDMLCAYTERVFNADTNQCLWYEDDQLPPTLSKVLDYADHSYYVFAPASIRAGLRGEKYYEFDYGYGPIKARSQKRLEKARLHVQDELTQFGDSDRDKITAQFKQYQFLDYYLTPSLS